MDVNNNFNLTEPYEIEEFDIEWADVDGRKLLATVYRPQEKSKFPTLLDVHGGAWTVFNRKADFNFDRRLAACGMVVVAIDFRRAPKYKYPAACVDVNAATRWVKANADSLKGSAEHFGLIGGSSGGHLVILSALRPYDPLYCGADGHKTIGAWQEGDEHDASASYVIALWPITDVPRRYQHALGLPKESALAKQLVEGHEGFFVTKENMTEASPQHIVESGEYQELPPILIEHPELDRQVTVPMQEDFVGAYEQVGGEIELEILPEMEHSPANIPGPQGDYCINLMKEYIASHLRTTEMTTSK